LASQPRRLLAPSNLDGSADNSNVPSRYRVYRYEIDHGHVGDVSLGGESGAPACYAGNGELSAVPDRRIVHAAIVNCQSLQLVGEAQSDIPVLPLANFSSHCLWRDRRPISTSSWSDSSGRAMVSATT
jgi:hypothetical protein